MKNLLFLFLLLGGTVFAGDSSAEDPALAGDLPETAVQSRRPDASETGESLDDLQKAAEKGDPAAQGKLGRRYEKGKGVRRDYSLAKKWYCLSAAKGSDLGNLGLGSLFHYGRGVLKDADLAVSFFRQAADKGNSDAMYFLGRIFYFSEGVSQDLKEAEKWFRLSAELGNTAGQLGLGTMYSTGEGVEKDLVTAYMWLLLASRKGEADIIQARDSIEREMTPEMIQAAQKLARTWKPNPN